MAVTLGRRSVFCIEGDNKQAPENFEILKVGNATFSILDEIPKQYTGINRKITDGLLHIFIFCLKPRGLKPPLPLGSAVSAVQMPIQQCSFDHVYIRPVVCHKSSFHLVMQLGYKFLSANKADVDLQVTKIMK